SWYRIIRLISPRGGSLEHLSGLRYIAVYSVSCAKYFDPASPMISTVQLYLTKRLLFASFIAMLAVFIPVLLIQLMGQLPQSALSSELLWPALFGLAPTIFFITLPVVVGIANTWAYSGLAAEGTLTILYTAGLSVLNVR